jgi:crotonobetainyl-CoA:carnitine CoA-transferase CaiB-like acyl-CoA transferase
MTPETPAPQSPLAGLRVIDFTHFLAGPMATLILADGGADVIKIENAARGDEFRHFQPPDPRLGGEGPPFLWCNRNERSVALDLKSEAGREIALALVKDADIVVENFSGRVMNKLGLGYETLSKMNPRLIYCAVSAYGREGPFADRLGFDPVVQAESGFISLNGFPDREGVRTGASVMDMSTGMMASNAILQAVIARYRTGRGQRVEVALYDTAITMIGYVATQHLFSSWEPRRVGNGSADTAPTGVFQASDKPFFLVCSSTPTFQRVFRDVAGMPEIADDPELMKPPGGMAQQARLIGILREVFAKHPRDHWLVKMRECGVPAVAVRTVEEALNSPETLSRGLVTHVTHPTAGTVPNVAGPMRFSETPVVAPVAAPVLGQHTREVLREILAFDDARMEQAARSGAFGKQAAKDSLISRSPVPDPSSIGDGHRMAQPSRGPSMPAVSTTSFYPVRQLRVHEAICTQVRDRLDSGLLKPGDKLLAECEMALAFHVSRACVREASRAPRIARCGQTWWSPWISCSTRSQTASARS